MIQDPVPSTNAQEVDAVGIAEQMVDLMLSIMSDGLDHPELWEALPGFVASQPMLVPVLAQRSSQYAQGNTRMLLQLLLGLCGAEQGETREVIEALAPLAADNSQSPLVQGVMFRLEALLNPDDPQYQLQGKICPTPFIQMDVLESSTHLCCASWLRTSAGNLTSQPWQDVWNGEAAQAIRASIHDGSYRYCNKGACPMIRSNSLIPAAELAARSAMWRDIVETAGTLVGQGPEVVNLAYDRTCNLSCPSCRRERFAADEGMRQSFDQLQQRAIMPLLRDARTVFVTGSGDPFASKNFRQLLHDLTPELYPQLKFQIMTNGMLFTPRQWESFPTLHRRVGLLKISIDAATGPTHELLRRGARWPVMLENMAFAGRLLAAGEIDSFELVFTVQQENFREMGDAIDLARQVGANSVYFARITNWGTFSHEEYRAKAVFMSDHPDYGDFLTAMRDPRLLDPMVVLGDLQCFADGSSGYVPAGMAA